MATTDPAVAAARRVWDSHQDYAGWPFAEYTAAKLIAAAREALASVRTWYEAEMAIGGEPDWEGLTKLIYTSGELQ